MDFYRRLSDPTKAALATAVFTFLSTAGLTILNLLGKIQEWLNGGDPITIEDVSVAGKVVLSAVVAAGAGLVNYAVRAWQRHKDPTAGPRYNS